MAIRAAVVTIGDELLIGQVVNTNASWIGEQLGLLGIAAAEMVTVGDSRDVILTTFARVWSDYDIVLVTGGLGPTHDDISKACVAEFFHRSLVLDPVVLHAVEERFRRFGYSKMPEVNRGQALVPEGFIALANTRGTAPGLWYADGPKVFCIMPGVPKEMRGLMQDEVLARLSAQFGRSQYFIRHRTLLTTGIGESSLSERVGEARTFLPADVTLAYLPSAGGVRLRITGRGADEDDVVARIATVEAHLRSRAARYLYGVDSDTLESVVIALLRERDATVATAESCTAGMVAARIANVPGASAVLMGSVVSYDNRVKESMLHVASSILAEHGAVSEETVVAMANGVRELLRTDYSIAVTGIAGPEGGTDAKPVGTVWIGVASAEGTLARRYQFAGDRNENRERATIAALDMLRRVLLKIGD